MTCYAFWIADMFHYTVQVDDDGRPARVWYDDLDHPVATLEWSRATGQPPSGDVRTALEVWEERKNRVTSDPRCGGGVPRVCKQPMGG
jgi:hypothetical protein